MQEGCGNVNVVIIITLKGVIGGGVVKVRKENPLIRHLREIPEDGNRRCKGRACIDEVLTKIREDKN